MSGITADAIDKVVEISKTEILPVGGRPYSTKRLFEVLAPLPAPLKISTLTGLADYLNENPDSLPLDEAIIEVSSHNAVRLYSTIQGCFEQRATYLLTSIELDMYPFGKYLDLELFIIYLQSKFVQDETIAALLKLAGNITGENVQNFSDDGVTQKVLARTGIVQIADAQVPNPVLLAPFRTFLEIEQPASKFVYRLKQGDGGGINCALIEADGGNWKLVATRRIHDWLKDQVSAGVTILA
jgi:hypothetical protein